MPLLSLYTLRKGQGMKNLRKFISTSISILALLVAFGSTAGYSALAFFATKAIFAYFGIKNVLWQNLACYINFATAFLSYGFMKGAQLYYATTIKFREWVYKEYSDLEKSESNLFGTIIELSNAFFSSLGAFLGMVSIYNNVDLAIAVALSTFFTSSIFGIPIVNKNINTILKRNDAYLSTNENQW